MTTAQIICQKSKEMATRMIVEKADIEDYNTKKTRASRGPLVVRSGQHLLTLPSL